MTPSIRCKEPKAFRCKKASYSDALPPNFLLLKPTLVPVLLLAYPSFLGEGTLWHQPAVTYTECNLLVRIAPGLAPSFQLCDYTLFGKYPISHFFLRVLFSLDLEMEIALFMPNTALFFFFFFKCRVFTTCPEPLAAD